MEDSTLMKLTKKELVEKVKITEKNYQVACERLNTQYKNYLTEVEKIKKESLKLAIDIIEKERIIAININPVMALGMNHVKILIEQELEKDE